MASFPSEYSFPCFLLFLLFSAAAIANGSGLPAEKTTNLRVYFHELFNTTSFVVASLHNNASTFGDIHVFDVVLTEGPEISSELVGRGQGISVEDSLGVRSILGLINFVFTAGEFNGSSLSLFGTSSVANKVNDIPVVGGSGKFRMARGYALEQIVMYNETYVLVHWDIYVNHY